MLAYFFSHGKSDSAFTGLQWGFWIGCAARLLYIIVKPSSAMSEGLGFASKFFSSDNGISNTPNTMSPPADPYYDKTIEGAGVLGGDVKVHTNWDDTLLGENGIRYRKNTNGTVSGIE